MNGIVARRLVRVGAVCSRQLSTSQPVFKEDVEIVKVNYDKLKKKQEHFQLDTDVPVYLKGGMFDRLFYHATIAVGIVGFSLAAKHMYEAAFPKK